jgi:hypothetical protein
MKITLELNGVKVEKEIPTRWKEVSFKQFLKLLEAGDDMAKILSIFTEIEEETLRKAKFHNLEIIISLLSFLKTDMNLVVPETCLGYKIPKNLEFESVGQFQDLKLEAMTMKEKDIERYALFCAIYATNPYDFKEAEKKKEEFLNAPSEEVMAIGNFTLMKLVELTSGLTPKSLHRNIRTKKFWRGLIVWLRNLDFTLRYYTWKKRHPIGGTNY